MAGMMVLVMSPWLASICVHWAGSKDHGVVSVACTRAVRHAGSTALALFLPKLATLVPTPIHVTPCSTIWRATCPSAVLFCCTTARGTRRPPYWAMPTPMSPTGRGPKYWL